MSEPLDLARAPGVTFAEQPKVFLRLVELKYRLYRATEVTPATIEDGLEAITEALENVELNLADGVEPWAILENLAEAAARALETAHAVVMGQLTDEQIEARLHEAHEDAHLAEFVQSVHRAPVAPDPSPRMDGAEITNGADSALRGARGGQSEEDQQP